MRTTAAVVALALATVAGSASAADYQRDSIWPSDLDLTVDVRRDESTVDFDTGREVDLRYTQINATLYQTGIRWFQPGLTLGGGWLSPDGDPAAEGLRPGGNNIGVVVRSEVPLAAGFTLNGRTSWVYHDLSDSGGDDDAAVSYEWADFNARLGLGQRIGRVSLQAGGTFRSVDGDRRVEDQETVRFDTDDSVGGYVQATVHLDDAGRIEFEVDGGARTSAAVRFGRNF